MKVYIAGPTKGYPRFNVEAFEEAARLFRLADMEVTLPYEVQHGPGHDLDVTVRANIEAVMGADVVVLLPGASMSSSAMMEAYLGQAIGIRVGYMEDILRAANLILDLVEEKD